MLLKRLFLVASITAFCVPLLNADTSLSSVPKSKSRTVVIAAGRSPVKLSVQGRLKFVAGYSGVSTAKMTFSVDGMPIGELEKRPYSVDWESDSVPMAEHVVAWKAFDSNGQEVASGNMTLVTGKPVEQPGEVNTGAPTSYTNETYGITIEHPSGWSAKDESKNLESGWNEGYWIVLSADPLSKATNVFNLRHRLSDVEQSPELFSKYATYVKTWERIDVGGRPAFFTSGGSESAKRVVHRCIILEGKHIWMANLIDTSGKPAAESKRLFLQMLRSMSSTNGLKAE
jgi:hypothetical protein